MRCSASGGVYSRPYKILINKEIFIKIGVFDNATDGFRGLPRTADNDDLAGISIYLNAIETFHNQIPKVPIQ